MINEVDRSDMNAFQCAQCSYEFEWPFQADRHFRRAHSNVHTAELFRSTAEPEAEPEQFSCVCNEFKSCCKLGLYEHWKHKHEKIDETIEPNSFREAAGNYFYDLFCDRCDYKSNSSLFAAKHADCCTIIDTKRDSIKRRRPTQISLRKCTQCSFTTKHRYSLKIHMLQHATSEEINWFRCNKCSYKAKQKHHLRTHMLKHASNEEIDWFTCTQCSYRAKHKQSLKAHVAKHDLNAPIDWFECAECLFRTKHRGSLRTHMLQHVALEDVKWFECDKCPYRSKRKVYLKQHSLKHEATWLRCTQCSYQTTRSACLRRHVMVRHPAEVEWFECTQCSYKAKQKEYLKKHNMMKHAVAEEVFVDVDAPLDKIVGY